MRGLRILWISNHTPFRVDFGGGQRSSLIYRTLRTVGDVDVLLLCAPHTPNQTVEQTHGKPEGPMEIVKPLQRGELWPWRWIRPCAPTLVDRIAYNCGRRMVDYLRDPSVGITSDRMLSTGRYDFIVGRHLKYASKAGVLGYSPIIVDVDDHELELYRSITEDPCTSTLRRIVLKQRIKSLTKIVPKLLNQSTCLWVAKEEDRDLPGCERASVLPNIPYAMSLPNPPGPLPPRRESQTILFVGMLSYLYNAQGIDSFLQESWPLIRQAAPQAILRLVGSHLTEPLRDRWAVVPGVEVVGFVEDLSQSYQDCAFAVVPIWSGAGTNIKVPEALMYGRTCVVSRHAHRGYGKILRDNESLMVGRTTREIADHCITLLRAPERRAMLAATGARGLASAYSFERFQREVLATVEAALRSRPRFVHRTRG